MEISRDVSKTTASTQVSICRYLADENHGTNVYPALPAKATSRELEPGDVKALFLDERNQPYLRLRCCRLRCLPKRKLTSQRPVAIILLPLPFIADGPVDPIMSMESL